MATNIKDKIAKLLALAESPNENEAKAALLKARELMAEHDGIKMRPVMQDARHVAAADTRCPHMYLYRSGKGFRGRKLLIAKILVAVQNCCFHC